MNPLMLYAAGGALLAGFLGGWTVRDWKADHDALAANNALIAAKDAANAAVLKPSTGLESILATLKPSAAETRNTIREVYRNVEVPADCAAPPAATGLLDAASARANVAAAGKLGETVR